ncbi:MAG TPA: asparagine synthase (glutamine-hydrolyzing) [Bryobacteraceae bacterium]|nr:asparagine synthase (glutamine-hydrolyzing) [Bryobacteraceae bacterium]
MCGIAGYITVRPAEPNRATLERMADTIRHRGPDECGYYQDAHASLGHRRLSIIDLVTGQQPMTNEDGRLQIVYNGEIFNHADLRPGLERAGHVYKTRCDTETILHAYEEYGPACVERFRGMFSFALWDAEARRLFCARDRLGKKPFYYYYDGRLFAFASEIKALLAHPEIRAALDESTLPEYLTFGYISDERTMFSGIRKLMPGHLLTLDVGEEPNLSVRQYWDIPPAGAEEDRSDESWIRECRERLEETVRMRLMSDVPLGIFLSGGLDSSAIAALVRRQATGPVKTFSVGYREAPYSELTHARRVAESIGTEHREVVVSMEEFFNALPRLVWHEDEPIVWPSSVSLYFVSRLAVEEVKVVLTGEGSDEMFGGYARYRHYLWNQRWQGRFGIVPAPLRSALRRAIAGSGLLAADLRRKLQHTFVGLDGGLESMYLDNFYCAFPGGEVDAMLRLAAPSSPYAGFQRYWGERSGESPLARMLFADQKTYLVELLMKQDQMSMATSIESRVPFLDHEFVEFSRRVPDRLKLRGREGKYIVKKAVEDLLPREIVYRPKMGFPTPLKQWLRDPRAEGIYAALTARDGLLASCCDRRRIEELVERQKSGRYDATDRIWRLLNLQIWGDVFLTGKGETRWEGLAGAAARA